MTDHGHQLKVVDDLWAQLSAIDVARDRRVRRDVGRRRTLRTALLVGAVLLGAVAVALAARALLFGAPAPQTVPSPPRAHFLPGTIRLLSLRVPDPGGGPPWGMRVAAIHKKDGCVQAGRVVDGRLAALGVDGSFGNDGRAHALPVSSENCGGIDAVGNLRVGGAPSITTASATIGTPDCATADQLRLDRVDITKITRDLRHPSPLFPPATRRRMRRSLRRARHELAHPPPLCPERDRRTILFGVLGPAARQITLSGPSQRTIVQTPTARDGGAYLFVLTGHPLLRTLRVTVRYSGGLSCPAPQPFATAQIIGAIPARCRHTPPGYVYRHHARP